MFLKRIRTFKRDKAPQHPSADSRSRFALPSRFSSFVRGPAFADAWYFFFLCSSVLPSRALLRLLPLYLFVSPPFFLPQRSPPPTSPRSSTAPPSAWVSVQLIGATWRTARAGESESVSWEAKEVNGFSKTQIRSSKEIWESASQPDQVSSVISTSHTLREKTNGSGERKRNERIFSRAGP